MTAARLLEGSGLGAAATARLMEAFERVSAAERETWRDPRRALLERIAELGDASLAPRLEPYLTDYDSSIATQAAALLAEWTGRSYVAAPRPLPREPVPTPAEYRVLDGARVVLSMRGGGEIVIELWPFLATTNVFRFARLAEEGWFDGLTFHRWAPNFVIQGGSPGANEYQGAGRYSRDEVGLQSHWRGTVGISTRGRDTGDAQIFVNLVDNVRLDHDYTIVGRVVEGMDVVDAVLEGSVIERAEVLAPRMSDR
jgi:cyclophilin family peptidyl-prolyl cis-trans isomerase